MKNVQGQNIGQINLSLNGFNGGRHAGHWTDTAAAVTRSASSTPRRNALPLAIRTVDNHSGASLTLLPGRVVLTVGDHDHDRQFLLVTSQPVPFTVENGRVRLTGDSAGHSRN